MGSTTCGSGPSPTPRSSIPTTPSCKVTLSTTCGSDLHFIDGYMPTMKPGDVIGHEFMGEVVEIGPEVKKVKKGDRVVVPSFIVCGQCWYCQQRALLAVRQHEPEAGAAGADVRLSDRRDLRLHPRLRRLRRRRTPSTSACRSPTTTASRSPRACRDEQVLFLSDAAPTGYMGADFCDIKPGDTIAVWGCGGVGLMAQRSAYLLGAERVIAIDRFPERLRMAREKVGSETINYRRSIASSRR